MIIGITGLIGSGKSTVAKLFINHGALVVDADQIAHQAYHLGTPTYQAIIALLGESICDQFGTINRKYIRELIQQDHSKLKQLEAIIHPFVIEVIRQFIVDHPNQLIILDVPLLFESKMNTWCEHVIFVDSPDDKRSERLWNRSQMTLTDANLLQQDLIDPEIKRKNSRFLIDNSKDVSYLEHQVDAIIKQVTF